MDNIVDLRFVGVFFFFFFFFFFLNLFTIFIFFYIIKFGPAMDNEWAGFFFGFHLSFSFSKKVFLNNFKI